MKRERIDLETIHRYKEHGQEEYYGCRLIGENVPVVGTDVYQKCFFQDPKEYFEENDLSRRIEAFESMSEYDFIVLETSFEKDVCDFKSRDIADVFVIEFDLKERIDKSPMKKSLFERIIRYFI